MLSPKRESALKCMEPRHLWRCYQSSAGWRQVFRSLKGTTTYPDNLVQWNAVNASYSWRFLKLPCVLTRLILWKFLSGKQDYHFVEEMNWMHPCGYPTVPPPWLNSCAQADRPLPLCTITQMSNSRNRNTPNPMKPHAQTSNYLKQVSTSKAGHLQPNQKRREAMGSLGFDPRR